MITSSLTAHLSKSFKQPQVAGILTECLEGQKGKGLSIQIVSRGSKKVQLEYAEKSKSTFTSFMEGVQMMP